MKRKHKDTPRVKVIFETQNDSSRKRKIALLSSEIGTVNDIKNKNGKGRDIALP